VAKQTFETLETRFLDWVGARAMHDPRYAEVADVYHWAKRHHTGSRDNGEPEFIHPLRLAIQVTDLIDHMEKRKDGYMPDALDLLKASICHDMLEDKDNDLDTGAVMNRHFLGRRIGVRAAQIVFNVSRKYIDEQGNKIRKNPEEDHANILSDPASLLLKHIDRNDNLQTMVDFTKGGVPHSVVYTPEKQKEKLTEAIQFMLQGSLPEHVEKRHGPDVAAQWLRRMNYIRHKLKLTVSKVLQRNVHYEVMHEIDAVHRYRVSELVNDFNFPSQPGTSRTVRAYGRRAAAKNVVAGTPGNQSLVPLKPVTR